MTTQGHEAAASNEPGKSAGAWRCMQNTLGIWRLYRFHGDGPNARMEYAPGGHLTLEEARAAIAKATGAA